MVLRRSLIRGEQNTLLCSKWDIFCQFRMLFESVLGESNTPKGTDCTFQPVKLDPSNNPYFKGLCRTGNSSVECMDMKLNYLNSICRQQCNNNNLEFRDSVCHNEEVICRCNP